MLRLIAGSVAALEQRLVLVTPPRTRPGDRFMNVTHQPAQNRHLVREMQRLRGAIYLDEGYLTSRDLTADGRHQTAEDGDSWHLLLIDERRRVRSCAFYRLHENATSIRDLRLRHCPLLERPESRAAVTCAVEAEIARARMAGLRFAELGGWAISRQRRGTPDGLLMALATYALSRVLGGALGITTANVAHACSSMLRRLGGAYLECDGAPIGSYFDPGYNTDIDLLRFDSRYPNPKYADLIELVMQRLPRVRVVSRLETTESSAANAGQPGCAA